MHIIIDYYSPSLSYLLSFFTQSLYLAILNLQDFSFTCLRSFLMPKAINYVLNVAAMVAVMVSNIYLQRYVDVCTTIILLQPEV